MKIITASIIAMLCATPAMAQVPDVTADSGLTYQVVQDGEVISEHRTQHVAQLEASKLEAANPDAETVYRINQVWRVESPTDQPDDGTADDGTTDDGTADGGTTGSGNGWTDLSQFDVDRKVYVSSSQGDDANGGLSSDDPVQSLDRARRLIREGRADWMLLKAGDEWDEQQITLIETTGPAAEAPMVIGVYGQGARPLIDPPSGQYAIRNRRGHFVVKGIEVYNREQDPDHPQFRNGDRAYGIGRLNSEDNSGTLLIEDCHLRYLADGVVADGQKGQAGNTLTIRRNIIVDCHAYGGRSQGILAGDWQKVLYEENVLDRNGWHPRLAPRGDGAQFSHNVYTASSNTDSVFVRRNITARASYNGMMMRSGGRAENNLSIRNPVGLLLKNGNNHFIRDNIVMESVDYQSGKGYIGGDGIKLKPVTNGAVTGNIAMDRVATNRTSAGITIWDTNFTGGGNVIPFENNITRSYSWSGDGSGVNIMLPNAPGKTTTSGNVVDGQRGVDGSGSQVHHEDPDRDMRSYMASIGRSGGFEQFMQAARSRPRGTWDERFTADAFNDHIRQGFTPATQPAE